MFGLDLSRTALAKMVFSSSICFEVLVVTVEVEPFGRMVGVGKGLSWELERSKSQRSYDQYAHFYPA